MEVGNVDAQQVFQLAIDNAPIGIALVAPDGTWLRVNQVLCEILGRSTEDLLATSFQGLTHPDDLEADLSLLEETLAGDRHGYQMEKRYLRPDGTVLWAQLDVVLVRDGTEPLYFISQLQDIGPRRHAEEELRRRALHDPLTGLPNRALFQQRLDRALHACREHGHRIGVGFLDVDDFKLINDTRGHDVGDRVLAHVASLLEASVRPGDTVARFGGDEFAVLFAHAGDGPSIEEVAEAARDAIRAPIDTGFESYSASASIGLVTSSTGAESVDDLLRHADLAMYEAKAEGKDRISRYGTHMERAAVDRLEIEQDLRRALEQAEFVPAYQPVLRLSTGATIGYEMLARWRRPGHGLVAAATFISGATRARLLGELTTQLLGSVSDDLDRLVAGDRCLHVNVTPDVLALDDVADRLRALAGRCTAPHQLVLEMTESELLHLDGAAAANLATLRSLGVLFAIDDFGTGYSSLSMVADLRPEILKIDMSFTRRLGEQAPAAILRAVCNMAGDLGMMTVGEGVELQAEAEELEALGCDAAQGFLYAPARPIAELGLA